MLEIKISPISIGLYHRFFVLLYSNQDDYFQNKKGICNQLYGLNVKI